MLITTSTGKRRMLSADASLPEYFAFGSTAHLLLPLDTWMSSVDGSGYADLQRASLRRGHVAKGSWSANFDPRGALGGLVGIPLDVPRRMDSIDRARASWPPPSRVTASMKDLSTIIWPSHGVALLDDHAGKKLLARLSSRHGHFYKQPQAQIEAPRLSSQVPTRRSFMIEILSYLSPRSFPSFLPRL
ncbi:unnamed protein product [Peniophora sp. CBMAI 1063]|nr:unnamed protein product [Peniophora sp. CBMAI 1063]